MVLGIVICVILVGIILPVILYSVARFMKGKLALELSRSTVSSGEPLSGRVNLTANKSIYGLLQVSLVGRERSRGRRGSRGEIRVRWVEVYRQDHILEETREFTPRVMQSYQFEIIAPTSAEARQCEQHVTLPAAVDGGVIGLLFKVMQGFERMIRGRIYWHVEARLEADGIDLYTKRKVRVDLLD